MTLHYITSHHITSHYVTLRHITLHHITSHYITLHYIALHIISTSSIPNPSLAQRTAMWPGAVPASRGLTAAPHPSGAREPQRARGPGAPGWFMDQKMDPAVNL